jgi:membrane protein involved in colicin uptake
VERQSIPLWSAFLYDVFFISRGQFFIQKLALAEKKKLVQEARKRDAELSKIALAEKKKLEQEARKKEAQEAKKKEEEDARIRLNNAISQKMQQEEEARQKAWEEHLQNVERAKQQSAKDAHDRAEVQRILDWKEKRAEAEAANKLQAAQFKAAQQQKRTSGHDSTSRAPFKKPRKESMFDYLRGPPPGC